ncbi:uncharacterized protein ACA1_007810 [Acanthamoeba castellanii str. Neff]|uniref:Uncharacterized protein n=1 Tax=Acanthamoeba castellanii (strain ATCC 30010 / Neff) TaxID=1257118 RepID=L8HAY5_ACACF|nr:uncharacterized protein ACA1_007810 [Acanthamoeba castellanii str. Neff]ELR21893.1 hypothetical protein ACA1_007810 [Acanthamoeba castellanii str. Neff]
MSRSHDGSCSRRARPRPGHPTAAAHPGAGPLREPRAPAQGRGEQRRASGHRDRVPDGARGQQAGDQPLPQGGVRAGGRAPQGHQDQRRSLLRRHHDAPLHVIKSPRPIG